MIFNSNYIDRDSSLPLFLQIERLIRKKIENKEFLVGETIPPERVLAENFKVSISTVKSASRSLINDGLLSRKKGKGTYVAKPKINEALVQNFVGFYEDMTEKGYLLNSKVLTILAIQAPPEIAEMLEIREGELIIHIDRVRYVNDEPICLVTSYYPYELCSGLINEDLTSQSIYGLLENKYGFNVVRAKRSLEAIAASNEDAKCLGIRKGDPILLLRSIAYLGTGRPIEVYTARHRGDRSKFGVEVQKKFNS